MRSARAHLPKPREIIFGALSAIPLDYLTPALLEERVVVRVRRSADAEEAKLARAVVLEGVPRTRRDQHCVAGTHVRRLPVDLHLALPFQDEVDLPVSYTHLTLPTKRIV